jgi:hypothetical protein
MWTGAAVRAGVGIKLDRLVDRMMPAAPEAARDRKKGAGPETVNENFDD